MVAEQLVLRSVFRSDMISSDHLRGFRSEILTDMQWRRLVDCDQLMLADSARVILE